MMFDLLADPDWDQPFFKVLAHNDTGAARGHQGGAAIPKDLRQYFPSLVGSTSAENPTIDRRLIVDLYLEDEYVGTVNARYQLQTWGGTRPPEARLTDNLGALRGEATAGDLLVMQRQTSSLDHYRLILVRKNQAVFPQFAAQIASARWGTFRTMQPMAQTDPLTAARDEAEVERHEFSMFETNPSTNQARGRRIARGIVFRERLKELYGATCCVCGTSLSTPSGQRDFEGAHIIPRSLKGADDVRNGLGLCRRHHWAFDKGLFGVDQARRVAVAERALEISENSELRELNGQQISEANQARLRANDEALKWHWDHVVASMK
jgi:putative restriction endonuclease